MPENQNRIINNHTDFKNRIKESRYHHENRLSDYTINLSYFDFINALSDIDEIELNNCTLSISENTVKRYFAFKFKISFLHCRFSTDFYLNELFLENNITFEYCILNKISFINLNSNNESNAIKIFIDNCEIKECIDILFILSKKINFVISGDYKFRFNEFITSPITIYNSTNNTISIKNKIIDNYELSNYENYSIDCYKCIFEKLFIQNNNKRISFDICRFNGLVLLDAVQIDSVKLEKCIFKDELHFQNTKINKIELINCIFEETVKIINTECSVKNINIERSTIKGIFLVNASNENKEITMIEKSSNVSFKHLFVEPTGYLIIRQITNGKFNFDYANILGQIVMQELDIESLQMHNASIIGSLIVQDIKLKELDLKNTSLIGKLVFNPSDTLNIFDSNIIQNRETAYLLKKGKQEEGDSISASHFKRKELSLYLNECLSEFYLWIESKINELKNLYNKWLKMPSKVLMCILLPLIPFIYILAILAMYIITPIILILKWLKVKRILDKECIVLFFNKISNDFGQSWVRGIIFTMSFAYIFYLLINFYGLEKPIFRFAWSLEGFGTAWKEYLKILNVLNFNDKLDNFKFTPLGETLFFVSKIFVSYGIYQTVSAFRKFGK